MNFSFINKIFTIILGFVLVLLLLWSRLIRERLPREIPYTLTILSFLLLCYICCIYAYILYNLLKKPKPLNPALELLINWILTPFIACDSFIKTNKIIMPFYKKFMFYIIPKLDYIFITTHIYYIIFAILPRIILVITLSIDVYYFHELKYIYKLIPIGILFLLNRYIIYTIKNERKQLFEYLGPRLNVITDYIPGVQVSENQEDDDEDDDFIPPTMLLDLEKFVEVQTHYKIKANKILYCATSPTSMYFQEIRKVFNMKPDQSFAKEQFYFYKEETNDKVQALLQLSYLLEAYNISNQNNTQIKYLKFLLFYNYLCSWLTILLKCLRQSDLDYALILDFILKILEHYEPF